MDGTALKKTTNLLGWVFCFWFKTISSWDLALGWWRSPSSSQVEQQGQGEVPKRSAVVMQRLCWRCFPGAVIRGSQQNQPKLRLQTTSKHRPCPPSLAVPKPKQEASAGQGGLGREQLRLACVCTSGGSRGTERKTEMSFI